MKSLKHIFFDDIRNYNQIYFYSKGIVVHLHLFYLDLLPEIMHYLKNIPVPYDFYITIPCTLYYEENELRKIVEVSSNVRLLKFIKVPNKGRDLAPFLVTLKDIIMEYDYVLHIHSKKSPHNQFLNAWRIDILEHLLPNEKIIGGILSLLSNDVNMVIPPKFILSIKNKGWGKKKNIKIAKQLMDKLNLPTSILNEIHDLKYPQGTMFWSRCDAISPLFELNLTYNDFPEEPIGTDGTIAHALERLFVICNYNSEKVTAEIFINKSEYLRYHYYLTDAYNIYKKRLKRRHKKIINKIILHILLGTLSYGLFILFS